jgi:hypothetical protein
MLSQAVEECMPLVNGPNYVVAIPIANGFKYVQARGVFRARTPPTLNRLLLLLRASV